MKSLYGKTILVGRNPQDNTLLVNIVGSNKIGVINRSVPGSVSRLIAGSNSAHLSVTIDQSGYIRVQNLKDANCTFVGGQEIRTKSIQPNAVLELGQDHFKVSAQEIINSARRLAIPTPAPAQRPVQQPAQQPAPSGIKPAVAPKQDAPAYNVHHLRRIWNSYKNGLKDIQIRRSKAMRNQRLPMLFSMGGGLISGVFAFALNDGTNDGISLGQLITGAFSLIGFGVMFFFMLRDPNIALTEEKERLDKELENTYLCPNPNCNKMLPTKDVDFILRQYDHKCPYCKCKFVDRH